MNQGTKILTVLLFLIINQMTAGRDVVNASCPAPSPDAVEITGTRQIVYNDQENDKVYLGLSDYSSCESAEFSYTDFPKDVTVKSVALNSKLKDIFALNWQESNKKIIITKNDNVAISGHEDYIFELNINIDKDTYAGEYGKKLENVITIETTINEGDSSYQTESFTLNLISKSFLGKIAPNQALILQEDILKLKDYILGKNPSDILLNRADIDSNGRINVVDIVGIIDILNKENPF